MSLKLYGCHAVLLEMAISELKAGDFIVHTAFLLLGAVIVSCWMALHALVFSGLGFEFF